MLYEKKKIKIHVNFYEISRMKLFNETAKMFILGSRSYVRRVDIFELVQEIQKEEKKISIFSYVKLTYVYE